MSQLTRVDREREWHRIIDNLRETRPFIQDGRRKELANSQLMNTEEYGMEVRIPCGTCEKFGTSCRTYKPGFRHKNRASSSRCSECIIRGGPQGRCDMLEINYKDREEYIGEIGAAGITQDNQTMDHDSNNETNGKRNHTEKAKRTQSEIQKGSQNQRREGNQTEVQEGNRRNVRHGNQSDNREGIYAKTPQADSQEGLEERHSRDDEEVNEDTDIPPTASKKETSSDSNSADCEPSQQTSLRREQVAPANYVPSSPHSSVQMIQYRAATARIYAQSDDDVTPNAPFASVNPREIDVSNLHNFNGNSRFNRSDFDGGLEAHIKRFKDNYGGHTDSESK